MSSLGASARLGDIDVLAWKSHEKIRIIECKRLRLPRTPREVADICRRFQERQKMDWINMYSALNGLRTIQNPLSGSSVTYRIQTILTIGS